MGRELKRVSMDFNWPLHKIWKGYINPFYKKASDCLKCGGTGYSLKAEKLRDLWYGHFPFVPEDRNSKPFPLGEKNIIDTAIKNINNRGYCGKVDHFISIEEKRLCDLYNSQWQYHLNDLDVLALVEADRLREFTHILTNDGWKAKNPSYVPTSKEVNDWSILGLGHDLINCWVVIKAECKRNQWEIACKKCNGEGKVWPSKKIKEKHENWERQHPVVGNGFQLWETTSNGSPVSPVFDSLEKLCVWCEDNAFVFGNLKVSASEWKKTLTEG